MRRPIGLRPGHVRAATSALTMATASAPARSSAVNARPRTIGTCSVSKWRGPIASKFSAGFAAALAASWPSAVNAGTSQPASA